jgi:hypothetical protein
METFILAIASFLLTLVNIICIVLCALIVLRIKEVAPIGAKNEQQQSDTDRFFHDDMRRFRDYQKTIHNTQELVDENKSGLSTSFHSSDSKKRERRKQLLALASLHDLDMTNQNDLTLNNAEARVKVKQLYKTMVQFDKDVKRLDIGMQNKQPLPTMMMDILPPKWTELFQHQQEQEIVEQQQQQQQQQVHNDSTHSHRSCHWNLPTHYNTYHDACTIHPYHHKYRTQSYSSNPPTIGTMSFTEQENETQLRGTRFRLTKATIPINDDEDEEQQHQQLNNEYV